MRKQTMDELFRESYQPMVALATAMTGSRAAGEDIVQECLERLHKRWKTLDNPGGYLRVAVTNECRSWRRSRARDEARHARFARQCDAAVVSDHSFDTLATVESLPPRQRRAVVLRYCGLWSPLEIAHALNMSHNTVKSDLRRGLASLRQTIHA